MDIKNRLKAVATGFVLVLYSAMPAMADDIEIYTAPASGVPVTKPNVMFIVDTSGSMSELVQTPATGYDHTVTYSDCYDNSKIYFSTTGTRPACGTSNYFNRTALKCDNAWQLYDAGVVDNAIGPLESDGYYSDQLARYTGSRWRELRRNNETNPVECKADSGIHGETDATDPYITNSGDGWTSTVPSDPDNPHPVWDNGDGNATLYDGNYLNFIESSGAGPGTERIEVAKDAVRAIVDANNNINICLMMFDQSSPYEGGPVIYPCEDVQASRNDFKNRLGLLTASGSTPLSEVYYEALSYFGGKEIIYGNSSSPSNQVGAKENGNPTHYESPVESTCQKHYIIYLTDGAPQRDYLSSTLRTNLAATFPSGSCNTDPDPGSSLTLADYNKDAFSSNTSTIDNCLDELAGWAYNNDVAEREGTWPGHAGEQNITTYTIGFDLDLTDSDMQAAEQLLKDTANKGGGDYKLATNQTELVDIINQYLAGILKVNSTFSSPAVSVNAFNRSTHLDDLYFTLFKPDDGERWEGNLKKYKIDFRVDSGDYDQDSDTAETIPLIVDSNSNPAVDFDTGFFDENSVSYWTPAADAPDGAETAVGGAASLLTNNRSVYTMTGTYTDANGVLTPSASDLTVLGNRLDKSNASVTDILLDTATKTPIVGTTPYRESLLDWAKGIDVLDEDEDGNATEAHRTMGDPLHAEPALVQYGEVSGNPDLVAYVATNDGYLHAINTLDGTEYFAFVPQELLPNLQYVFERDGVLGKAYGLDGNVVAWINDSNGDHDLYDGADHVYIYFSMRRGGNNIYSLDVTNRTNPILRWVIEGGSGDYAELAQTWSSINVETIQMGGTERRVLIFGGGYDTGQDTSTTRTADTEGRGIFIVDADTGALLWRAGPDAGADLTLGNMQYSIPARIKPLDIDGDGFIDRLYTGDMGGQLWRFDIDNDASTAANVSATGGRIANLAADGSTADNRRFYYPPDVALIVQEGQAPFLSILAASGYRAHPNNTAVHDRIYMIRDYDIYQAPGSYTTVTEADLFDTTDNIIGEGTDAQKTTATTNLNNAKGWFITLNELDGSFVGEKSLSEPLILNGVGIVTTFIPASASLAPSNSCEADDGTGAAFFINITDGTPTYDLTGNGLTRSDRRHFLKRGGIPPSPNIIITTKGDANCIGTECFDPQLSKVFNRTYWYEVEQ